MSGRVPTPAAPALLRVVAAFTLLTYGPMLFCQLVVRVGVPAETAQQQGEVSLLGLGLAGLLLFGLARLWPPGPPMAPMAPLQVLRRFVPFWLLWVAFACGYLFALQRAGVAVPRQPLLDYIAAGEPDRPGFWLVAGGIALYGPLIEEVLFRGYLQEFTDALLPRGLSLVATAAAFGAVHGNAYFLPIGVLGLLFGWLRQRHDSLLAPFLAHALHNSIVVAAVFTWPGLLDLLYPR